MIQAKIVIAETETQRSEYIARELATLTINPADAVYLELAEDKEHIGISQVRDFTRQMILSPMASVTRAGVIAHAQLLTSEAQNALLKIIEEPPKNAVFILGSDSPDALLPTVISRCQIVNIAHEPRTSSDDLLAPPALVESLIASSPGEILSTVQSIAADRNATKLWTISAIRTTRDLLLSELRGNKNPRRLELLSRTIRALEQARKELSSNVTPRLVLEHAFLSRVR